MRKAISSGGDVQVKKLAEWGKTSHVSGTLLPIENECFRDALIRNPVRARMAAALALHPFRPEGDNELKRLARLLPSLVLKPESRDLAETVTTILAYEECFRLLSLGFERLLLAVQISLSQVTGEIVRLSLYSRRRLHEIIDERIRKELNRRRNRCMGGPESMKSLRTRLTGRDRSLR